MPLDLLGATFTNKIITIWVFFDLVCLDAEVKRNLSLNFKPYPLKGAEQVNKLTAC